ncbi:MAG TPA: universal stress protein [Trebonia sp.]|nr:universal stress protein [Trebonia sp.]
MTVNPIVAAIDGSPEALRAVGWAVGEAVLRDAPLRIVSGVELPPRMSPRKDAHGPSTVAEIVTAERDHDLTAAAERATAISPDLRVSTGTLSGPVAQAVADSGAAASMLVVGSRGAGAFAAMILGSVSRYVATHAACPVVVVRDDSNASRQGQVVVGVRDAEDGDATLTFAFEEAALHSASLLAVHAWQADDPDLLPNEGPVPGSHAGQAGAARQLESLLDGWREKYPGVAVSQEVVHGHPGRALAGLSARAGLIVLGRHYPHRGPGRVIHAVLNHAHCPVATVPAPRQQ